MAAGHYLQGAVPYPEELARAYASEGWWMNKTYGDILDFWEQFRPNSRAIIDERATLTYRELKQKVDSLAIAFLRLGIRQYDRIIFQLPNRHEFVVAFHAAQRIGAVPVLTVARQEYQEISHFFKLAEPIAWIMPSKDGTREFAPLVERIRAEASSLKFPIFVNDGLSLPSSSFSIEQLIESVRLSDYPPDYLQRFRPDPNDVTMIVTTGGTTGLPKGVPRTHNSFLTNVRYTNTLAPADVVGLATPIGHTMAQQGAVGSSMFYGATLAIIPGPRAKDILEAIDKWGITHVAMVPTQLEDLLNYPELDRYSLRSLKQFQTAGAALRHETADRAHAFAARIGADFYGGGYGSSEGPCAGGGMRRLTVPPGSIGRPYCEGDHWKVINDSEQEVPFGAEGELVCKGPTVFAGYYKSEGENRETFTHNGYYKTGDLGRIDVNGNIFITGRKKDIIQRGGEGIIPKQIEDLLHQLPNVEQAAVVGMPDARLGERACAYVVLKHGATLTFEAMVRLLKEKGAGVLLLPERLEVVDALPKTNVGKIDKKALRTDIVEKLRKLGAGN
jgi:non-ribosomal peptide synthetase component E (peptide arylation enzyme)